METIKKIVVIGPESAGKSTLCSKLAAHYNTLWVPEFAREYLEKNGAEYDYADLLTIAKGQIELEEKIRHEASAIRYQASGGDEPKTSNLTPNTSNLTPNTLFIDTDLYVMKVWSEFVFNECHNWILNRIAERKYDLYLLCATDLPWVQDELREYPDEKIRKNLFCFYKDIMVNQSTPWCIISGNYEERFGKSVKFIEDSFTKKNVQK
ncbi:MAG TPA: ATP-binding protein [Hanamia sp.]|nr:ATP-binding protein [Hanamia sp.]